MENYQEKGKQIRNEVKELLLNFMQNNFKCNKNGEGIKQAELFRSIGLDWENQENATSTNQQYWLVALLRVLEKENKVQRDSISKKWRLK